MTSEAKINHEMIEKIEYEFADLWDTHYINSSVHWDDHRNAVVTAFNRALAGIPEEMAEFRARYPRDWWQALRERWFPRFWLRKWPVVYKDVYVAKRLYKSVCPHLYASDKDVHLGWLVGLPTHEEGHD